ncbi:MAG: hypothetical protein V2J42_01605 [Wenzhouxiangella sp.]|jgi:hypothetical protein|nr:hypothetical protein [Wenzhouxiangella sp.]
MRTYVSAMLLIFIVLPSTGKASETHNAFCESGSTASIALDFQEMLQDPYVAELLFLKEEMLTIVASADKSNLLKYLQAGDLESAARVAGLSGKGAYPYRENLHVLSAIVLKRYPELVEFMPQRPAVDSTEIAAIMLERLPALEHLDDTLLMPFSQILPELESSSFEKKHNPEAGSLLWSGGLTPPPSGPFNPCELGAWNPDCRPESPDLPLPDHPDLPDDGPPWDAEGSCQAGPYFAGMILCAALPTALIPFCMYQVMCSTCEGGIFDTLCFAD